MIDQRHDVAVQSMQKPVENVVLLIERSRETSSEVGALPIKNLTQEIRSGTSPNNSVVIDDKIQNKDIVSTTVSKDIYGSPGFSLTQNGLEVIISAIKPGGPADKENKLKIGDLLLSVNGSAVSGLNLDQIKDIITKTPGEVYLVVQRKPVTTTDEKHTPTYVNSNVTNGINSLSYSDNSIDGRIDIVELIRDENNSLGLSIVGGIDHCSHPFGVNNPGVFISKIAPSSPAANSGLLRIGDRILSVGKDSVEKSRHNDAVMLLKNSGKKLILKVKHEPRPSGLREIVFKRRINEPIGLSICGGINSPPANPFDPTDEGIFIEKVEKDSAADECGLLEPGIRILEINDESLLGCTQVEAASIFRKTNTKLKLLVCDGFKLDSVSLIKAKLCCLSFIFRLIF